MPLVTVTMRKGRTREERRAVLDGVHSALVDTFKITERDRKQRIIELEPENFDIPPGSSDRYLIVEVRVFTGRPVDTKRALYKSVVAHMGKLGIDPVDVFIMICDWPRENWGIRGGKAACDVELGFTVEV